MTIGIVYIARNEVSDPRNHYKIGKSYKADPILRMEELNSVEVNYRGKYECCGYVLVNNVDECELIMHRIFAKERINKRREFFEVELKQIIFQMKSALAANMIQDHLPTIYEEGRITYNQMFNLIRDFKNLDFITICKIALFNKIGVRFLGIPTTQMWYLLFVLIHKDEISRRKSQNPNFDFFFNEHIRPNSVPNLKNYEKKKVLDTEYDELTETIKKKEAEEVTIDTNNELFKLENKLLKLSEEIRCLSIYNPLSPTEAEKLQNEVINTDMKKYLEYIPYEENLLYLGVVLSFIEKTEQQNRKIENYLLKNLKELFSVKDNYFSTIKEFKERINQTGFLVWGHLYLLTPLFED